MAPPPMTTLSDPPGAGPAGPDHDGQVRGEHGEVLRLRQDLATRDDALRSLERQLSALEATGAPRSVDDDLLDGYEERIASLAAQLATARAEAEAAVAAAGRDRDDHLLLAESLRSQVGVLQSRVVELQGRVDGLEARPEVVVGRRVRAALPSTLRSRLGRVIRRVPRPAPHRSEADDG
jgi:chromosome segregation ATPase